MRSLKQLHGKSISRITEHCQLICELICKLIFILTWIFPLLIELFSSKRKDNTQVLTLDLVHWKSSYWVTCYRARPLMATMAWLRQLKDWKNWFNDWKSRSKDWKWSILIKKVKGERYRKSQNKSKKSKYFDLFWSIFDLFWSIEIGYALIDFVVMINLDSKNLDWKSWLKDHSNLIPNEKKP